MEFRYDIIETIAVLSDKGKGWRKELNLISWNGGKAKLDIRDWSEDHQKMGKGITLSEEEAGNLAAALCETVEDGERDEAIYRKKEIAYTMEDARRQVMEYLDLEDEGSLPDIDYEYLAQEFLDNRDCNRPDNDAWQAIIRDCFEKFWKDKGGAK